MRLTTIFILIALLNSCGKRNKQEFIPNERLIAFSDNFVMEIDSFLEQDHHFNKESTQIISLT